MSLPEFFLFCFVQILSEIHKLNTKYLPNGYDDPFQMKLVFQRKNYKMISKSDTYVIAKQKLLFICAVLGGSILQEDDVLELEDDWGVGKVSPDLR